MSGKPMTKSELIGSLSERAGITKATAATVVDSMSSIACEEVKDKGEFTIPGIGKLVISERSARKGRNPATGELIEIPAKKVIKFRVAKACKDSVLD